MSALCRKDFVIPPGLTYNEHQASRRYGSCRPGGATKDSFRATGLMFGNAVLGAVSVKPDVTQAIAFRWRECMYQRETLAKREWFNHQHAAPQIAKIVLDKIHRGGRHSERILLIFLKNKLSSWVKSK